MLISVQWGDKKDDAQVIRITECIIEKSVALAKSRHLDHRYIYQNYAYITQDVFSGMLFVHLLPHSTPDVY